MVEAGTNGASTMVVVGLELKPVSDGEADGDADGEDDGEDEDEEGLSNEGADENDDGLVEASLENVTSGVAATASVGAASVVATAAPAGTDASRPVSMRFCLATSAFGRTAIASRIAPIVTATGR